MVRVRSVIFIPGMMGGPWVVGMVDYLAGLWAIWWAGHSAANWVVSWVVNWVR